MQLALFVVFKTTKGPCWWQLREMAARIQSKIEMNEAKSDIYAGQIIIKQSFLFKSEPNIEQNNSDMTKRVKPTIL